MKYNDVKDPNIEDDTPSVTVQSLRKQFKEQDRYPHLKKLNRLLNSAELSEWEAEFCDSVQDQVNKGKELSQKQIDKINQLFERKAL